MISNDNEMKKQKQIINKLLKKPENKYCADCKSNPPSWASINLGVLICIKCSSTHRELGTHISKIKSINLDVWPSDILEKFLKIDNKISNDYWEHNLSQDEFNQIKIDPYKVMDFIRNKYEYKKYVNNNDIPPIEKMQSNNNVSNNNSNNNNNNNNNFNWNYFNNLKDNSNIKK
jgi:stromal membrane-associated protein